jgi:PadR family transcriptional regulator PadR
MRRDLFKGDLPVLIMAVLEEAPCHGYAIAREIERRSGGSLGVKEGALYPALRVLENNGWIEGQWQEQTGTPPRKIYRLTQAGHTELQKSVSAWRQYAASFESVLRPGGHHEPA